MTSEFQGNLVSVIIPTYNASKYLSQTLLSVFAQTYNPIEVIVIDDGSQDNTPEVIAPFQSRLIYIRQENFGGPSGPRNVGLSHASGEYVALFDSDDIMHEDKITKEMAVLTGHPGGDLVFTDFSVIDENGNLIKERFLDSYTSFRNILEPCDPTSFYLAKGVDLFHALLRSNFIGTSSVLARKNALLEAGGFDQTLLNADDIDMWHKLARAGMTFTFIDEPLHSYRRRSGSISRSGSQRYPNMIRMLNKQLPHIHDQETLAFVREKIHRVTLGFGSVLLSEKKPHSAKSVYREALGMNKTWAGVKGLLISKVLSLFTHNSDR